MPLIPKVPALVLIRVAWGASLSIVSCYVPAHTAIRPILHGVGANATVFETSNLITLFHSVVHLRAGP